MNTDTLPTPGPERADTAAPAPSGWSNRDHAALPALPLGPKAAALQTRRRERLATRSLAMLATRSGIRLSTADAAVTFVMRGAGGALYIERTQRRPLGTCQVQSMVFSCVAEFDRWCAAEPTRFEDPNLHQRLRRHGQEFFDAPG